MGLKELYIILKYSQILTLHRRGESQNNNREGIKDTNIHVSTQNQPMSPISSTKFLRAKNSHLQKSIHVSPSMEVPLGISNDEQFSTKKRQITKERRAT